MRVFSFERKKATEVLASDEKKHGKKGKKGEDAFSSEGERKKVIL